MLRRVGQIGGGVAIAGVSGALVMRHQVIGVENFDRSVAFYRVAIPGYIRYKSTDLATRGGAPEKRDEAFGKLHQAWAPAGLDIILQLRGFYIKIGQMAASNIGGAFPEHWVRTMEVLQDNVPAKDFATVRGIVEAEMGKAIEDVFSDFEETPLGAASIGQVHRAVLRDGRRVVVKVQYPEVERLFRGDIWTITFFCQLAQPEHVPSLREIEKQFMTEFDYTLEALQLNEIRANMRRAFGDRVVIPEAMLDLCTPKMLVMEELYPSTKLADGLRMDMRKFAALQEMTPEAFLAREKALDREAEIAGRERHGPSSTEMDGIIAKVKAKVAAENLGRRLWNYSIGWLPGIRRRPVVDPRDVVPLNHARLVDDLLEIHGHQILLDGRFNGDPHPGNVLLVHDGAAHKLGLIDYGQVKSVDVETRVLFAKILVALAANDEPLIVELIRETGYETKYNKPETMYKLARVFFDRDDAETLEGKHAQTFLDEIQARDPIVKLGEEFVMPVRVSIMLRGIGHVLKQHRSTAQAWLPLARRVLLEQGEAGFLERVRPKEGKDPELA